ncbi:Photoreceptor ankyrin repeat protein [Saguinus oedipus]|uniref:Photoreceptor ankyrin repeat protein n=2 Tax=Saguinus oedipus TaxID=9490 RepID=A0ABQ9T9S9_SAGOE|nr:Photoreceptor ankyrin repeat protein [Saguinus oedipus]
MGMFGGPPSLQWGCPLLITLGDPRLHFFLPCPTPLGRSTPLPLSQDDCSSHAPKMEKNQERELADHPHPPAPQGAAQASPVLGSLHCSAQLLGFRRSLFCHSWSPTIVSSSLLNSKLQYWPPRFYLQQDGTLASNVTHTSLAAKGSVLPIPPMSAPCILPGADLTAVDPVRGKTALEWAVLTDSFDTVWRIRQLQRRPQVEQLSQHYQPEWPALPRLVAQAQAQVAPSLLERLQATLSLPFAPSPQDGGVLDHLVTATTSLASPFLTTACHTLCPDHPPSLVSTAPPPPLVPKSPPGSPQRSPWTFVPYQSPQGILSKCPQWLQPKDSTSPRPQVPKILLSKASSSPNQCQPKPSPARHRSLALPLWRYQELRMERRKQEEEDRMAQK